MKINESLAKYTTLGLGGPADCMIEVHDLALLKKVLVFVKKQKMPLFVLGGGSNILVKDGGIRGLVIRLKEKLSGVKVKGNEIVCGGGATLAGAVVMAAAKGLTGLEFAAGIPGTSGGASIMNAGANGFEMKDVIKSVTVMDKNGKIKKLSGRKCGFVYRGSKLKNSGLIVTSVAFMLKKGNKKEVKAKILKLVKKRKALQPCAWGTAGCVFKNPEIVSAGRLIDECGLKGAKMGKVEVSRKHANFFINRGKKAADFIKLMEHVKRTVFRKKGVRLEEEIIILGENR